MKVLLRGVLQDFGFELAQDGEKSPILVKASGEALEESGVEYKLSPYNPRVGSMGEEKVAREIERTVSCGCDSCMEFLGGLYSLIRPPEKRRYWKL